MKYPGEQEPNAQQGRLRNGMPEFYKLLENMANIHDKKSHDYASNDNPAGNYHFAGKLSKLFNNPDDAGFIGRIGEKLYRLANLENSNKFPSNESIEDTEKDICVITVLWMADRLNRRTNQRVEKLNTLLNEPEQPNKGIPYHNQTAETQLWDKPKNTLTGILLDCEKLTGKELKQVSDYTRRFANDLDTEYELLNKKSKTKTSEPGRD